MWSGCTRTSHLMRARPRVVCAPWRQVLHGCRQAGGLCDTYRLHAASAPGEEVVELETRPMQDCSGRHQSLRPLIIGPQRACMCELYAPGMLAPQLWQGMGKGLARPCACSCDLSALVAVACHGPLKQRLQRKSPHEAFANWYEWYSRPLWVGHGVRPKGGCRCKRVKRVRAQQWA